jgi:hypothetical protein
MDSVEGGPDGETDAYAAVSRTTPSRHRERAHYDRATVHAILDEAIIAHLSFIVDGAPSALPMLFVRVDEDLFLHSSTGAHPARLAARAGALPVAVEVTLVDGLVLARAAFSHSANYRTVIAHGDAVLVGDSEEKDAVLRALMEKLLPGRADDVRAPSESELRQTAVLRLPLAEVSAKVRSGGPLDADDDLGRGTWAGVVPFTTGRGEPEPSADLEPGVSLPTYLVE